MRSVAVQGACLLPLKAEGTDRVAGRRRRRDGGGVGSTRGAQRTREDELLKGCKWPWVGFPLAGLVPRLKRERGGHGTTEEPKTER